MNDVLAIRRDSENVISVTIPAETNTSDVINILKAVSYTHLDVYKRQVYIRG